MKKLDIEIIKSIISTIKKVTKKKNVSKLHVPTLSKLEGIYLKKCLDTNMLSTIGPFVEIFENVHFNFKLYIRANKEIYI